jgi:hypothetical protein
MSVLKELLSSEKAIFVGLLIVAATVLTGMGKMTIDQWIAYTEWMAVTYVAGKTIQGTAAVIKNGKKDSSDLKKKLSDSDAAVDTAIEDKFKKESEQ